MAEAFGIACHELVSLDFRCGSRADEIRSPVPRLLLRVKQSKSASTSAFGGKLAVAEGAPGQPLLATTSQSENANEARAASTLLSHFGT